MNLQYKTFTFKAADPADNGESGLAPNEFDGYASTFLGVDSYGEIMAPGCFKNTLAFFLENGVLLREHSIRAAIGKPIECREDTIGLYLKGRISETTEGKDCLTLMRDKVIKRLSIGFVKKGYEVLSEARAVELIGQAAYDSAMKSLPWYYTEDGLTLITDVELWETSLVAFPANADAVVTGVKSLMKLAGGIQTEREFERFLRDAGFSHKNATAIALHGFKAMQRDAAPENPVVETSTELADQIKSLAAQLRGQ